LRDAVPSRSDLRRLVRPERHFEVDETVRVAEDFGRPGRGRRPGAGGTALRGMDETR